MNTIPFWVLHVQCIEMNTTILGDFSPFFLKIDATLSDKVDQSVFVHILFN